MPHSSAQDYLRTRLKKVEEGGGPARCPGPDALIVAMGLLAVAEAIESLGSSVDRLAVDGGDGIARALSVGLGDLEASADKLATAVGNLELSR
jgi:hypothetical protein